MWYSGSKQVLKNNLPKRMKIISYAPIKNSNRDQNVGLQSFSTHKQWLLPLTWKNLFRKKIVNFWNFHEILMKEAFQQRLLPEIHPIQLFYPALRCNKVQMWSLKFKTSKKASLISNKQTSKLMLSTIRQRSGKFRICHPCVKSLKLNLYSLLKAKLITIWSLHCWSIKRIIAKKCNMKLETKKGNIRQIVSLQFVSHFFT